MKFVFPLLVGMAAIALVAAARPSASRAGAEAPLSKQAAHAPAGM